MPGLLFEIIKTPPQTKVVGLPYPLPLLFSMKSPDFSVLFHAPLQFSAVGSGAGSLVSIQEFQDVIVAGDIGNFHYEYTHLENAVHHFVRDKKIDSVGGLFPAVKMSSKGFEILSTTAEIPVGGPKIALSFENGRWVQRNLATGKSIELVPPWAVGRIPIASREFNDLNEAFHKMRGTAP